MEELARELGMSKKTLYLHFAGKEKLVEAVLRQRLVTMEATLLPIVEAKIPFREKFARMTMALQTRLAEMSPMFFDDIRRRAPGCFHIVEEFRSRAIPRYFGQLLDEGIRSGDLRSDLDQALLIRLLVTAIQGIIRPEVMGELHLAPQTALAGLLDMIFQGVLTPRGRRGPSTRKISQT